MAIKSTLKILFCWSDISGYMSACWKALSNQPDVDLHVIAFAQSEETSFSRTLTDGLSVSFVNRAPSKEKINEITDNFKPDVVVLCGWFVPAYKQLAFRRQLINAKFILAMDTPWRGTLRQRLGAKLLKGFVQRMDAVVTSGERSFQYARRIEAKRVYKMQYGVNVRELSRAAQKRTSEDWPTNFLFVGRYSREKGIGILIDAYCQYRTMVDDPWDLHTCGQGPLEHLFAVFGVKNHGFVQPDEMTNIWASAGCLVLPSTFDPWPLIVVEACAAGLPVIVTHASGSQVEVVKMFYNGLVIKEGSKQELGMAMLWIHQHYDFLPEMGRRSSYQAEPYSSEMWAQKWGWMVNELCKN